MTGKGDKRRPEGKQGAYRENYDRIFEQKSEEMQAQIEETIRQARQWHMTNEEIEAYLEDEYGLQINLEELDRESETKRPR